MAGKRTQAKRARGIPLQVYVSAAEREQIEALLERRHTSLSRLVRTWIRRAIAQSRERRPPPADKRQTLLF